MRVAYTIRGTGVFFIMSTELQQLNVQTKVAMWAERISACRNSGLNVKSWCKKNGVCEQTYYKWQKKIFAMAKAQQELQFAEVTPIIPSNGSGQIALASMPAESQQISITEQIQPRWKLFSVS